MPQVQHLQQRRRCSAWSAGPTSSFLVISDPEAAKHVLRATDNPKRPLYDKGLVAEVPTGAVIAYARPHKEGVHARLRAQDQGGIAANCRCPSSCLATALRWRAAMGGGCGGGPWGPPCTAHTWRP